MVLPPGRDPIPVSGINKDTDPDLWTAAGELNTWIDYLLHPESHDGPRIYRLRDMPGEFEVARRDPFYDGAAADYETVSVLERYAGDIDAFFRPAKAVSGISAPLIEQTYNKLTQGFFTWEGRGPGPAGQPTPKKDEDEERKKSIARYQELNAAQGNWSQMRNGSDWQGREANAAHDFEGAFINFQLYTENCFYVVAEHLVRYRAIFQKAGEDITKLMSALTDKFATFDPRPTGGGVSVDILSIVVTGLVAATTTVITGGAGAATAIVAFATAVEMIGEAVKTAEPNAETTYRLESREHLRDVAQQYLDAVNGIARDVEVAVKQLYENLRTEVDSFRAARTYKLPYTGENATSVPRYRDFL